MLTIHNPELRKAQQQKLLNEWSHPVGTAVTVTDDDGNQFNSKTSSHPRMLGGHTAVIDLGDICGAYALERVQPLEVDARLPEDGDAANDCTLEEPKMRPETKEPPVTKTPRTFEPPVASSVPASDKKEPLAPSPAPDSKAELKPLRLQQLIVRNVMGIEDYTLELDGSLTRVTGHNAAGKTSLVSALLSLFGGGSTAEMIHNGAERAEIVGVMSNGIEARKRIGQTRGKSGITVKENGRPVPSPATFMKTLADMCNLNPLEFVQAKPAQQVELLFQALPMTITAEELLALTGIDDIDCDNHALNVLDAAYRRLYDSRTGVNGSVRKSQESVLRIEQSLPEDWTDRSELEASKATLDSECETFDQQRLNKHRGVDQEAEDGYRRINTERDENVRQVDDRIADVNRQIQALQEELVSLSHAKKETDLVHASKSQQIKSWAESQKTLADHECEQNSQAARSEIEKINLQLQSLTSHESTRRMLDDEKAELTKLLSQQASLNDRIDAIRTRKGELINDIPIDGLTVENGALMANGVPFNMVNTAEQLRLAVKIAELRLPTGPGALRLIVIDRAESMDTKTIHELHNAARVADIQLLLVGTDDCELTVTHGDNALCRPTA